MDPHHRKIDLQSPQDLTYLLKNINAAAQQNLDIHFPPSAAPKGEEDAFRKKVEELVHQYITQTLTLALPSLSINGLDASPSLLSPSAPSSLQEQDREPNYEPYDPRLAARLRSLYATLETETTRVAELRREAPSKAAALYVENLRREMQEEEGRMEDARRWVREEGGRGEMIGVGLERGEEVRENWERGTRGLEGLRLTEGVAVLERVKGVVGGVEGG